MINKILTLLFFLSILFVTFLAGAIYSVTDYGFAKKLDRLWELLDYEYDSVLNDASAYDIDSKSMVSSHNDNNTIQSRVTKKEGYFGGCTLVTFNSLETF